MDQIKAIEMAKSGDNEGMAYLYETTYQKSYYVALKYMKNEHSAMDVLQDAYIKAFENIDKLDNPEKFESWMKTIVAHTALNELRKNNPMLFSETENDEGQTIEDTFEDDRVQVQPEIAMDQKETSRLVQEMMEGLSDEQRVCITMFYMEDFSVKEIAEILNVSENTVKSRLNYGRKNIKEKVLDLEKKGTKLYGMLPMAFFLWLFKTDAEACSVAVSAFTAKIGGAGATASATAKAGAATATTAVSTKAIIAGIAAVVVVGGAAGMALNKGNDPVEETVEAPVEIVEEVVEEEEEPAYTEGLLEPSYAAIYDNKLYLSENLYEQREVGVYEYDLSTGSKRKVIDMPDAEQYEEVTIYDGHMYCVICSLAWDHYAKIFKFDLETFESEEIGKGDDILAVDGKLYIQTFSVDGNILEAMDLETGQLETIAGPGDGSNWETFYYEDGEIKLKDSRTVNTSELENSYGGMVYSYAHLSEGYVFADVSINYQDVYFLDTPKGDRIRLN